MSYQPGVLVQTDLLTVYIEGDGLPWSSRSRPSADPTPLQPMGLQLAVRDPGAAAYLARPCQYLVQTDPACEARLWTGARFSDAVIASTSAAVDQLKARSSAHRIRLVGYSGGGAVAVLVAARREDVVSLITVAGNLDHTAWTQLHRVSPLSDSLNAANQWQAVADIPQRHFVGGKDRIVPPIIADSYVSRFPADKRPEIVRVDAFSHGCCWKDAWPDLIEDTDVPGGR